MIQLDYEGEDVLADEYDIKNTPNFHQFLPIFVPDLKNFLQI